MGVLYFYSSLPPLVFGEGPPIDSGLFYTLFCEEISMRGEFVELRSTLDLINLSNMLLGVNYFDNRANYSRDEMQLFINDRSGFVERLTYLVNGLSRDISKLMDAFYDDMIRSSRGFVREFLSFDYNIRRLSICEKFDEVDDFLKLKLHIANLKDPSIIYQDWMKFRFNFFEEEYLNFPNSLRGVLGYMLALWSVEDFAYLRDDESVNLDLVFQRGSHE